MRQDSGVVGATAWCAAWDGDIIITRVPGESLTDSLAGTRAAYRWQPASYTVPSEQHAASETFENAEKGVSGSGIHSPMCRFLRTFDLYLPRTSKCQATLHRSPFRRPSVGSTPWPGVSRAGPLQVGLPLLLKKNPFFPSISVEQYEKGKCRTSGVLASHAIFNTHPPL